MTLSRTEAIEHFPAELDAFGELVKSLDKKELQTPSRCEGWTVGDVAAHVIGTMTDIVNGRVEGQGTPEVTARQVEERRGRTGAELAEELEGATKIARDMLASFDDTAWETTLPNFDGTLGWGIEALWYDAYLHADDIRSALGRPSLRSGPGLRAAVSHMAYELDRREWGPGTLALDGQEEFAVGAGGGQKVTGDAFDFVLACTGRGNPDAFGVVNIYAD